MKRKIAFYRVGQPVTLQSDKWNVRAASFEATDFIQNLLEAGLEVDIWSESDLWLPGVDTNISSEIGRAYGAAVIYCGVADRIDQRFVSMLEHGRCKEIYIINQDARTFEPQPWFHQVKRLKYQLCTPLVDELDVGFCTTSIKAAYRRIALARQSIASDDPVFELKKILCFQNMDGENCYKPVAEIVNDENVSFFGTIKNVKNAPTFSSFFFRKEDARTNALIRAAYKDCKYGLCFQSVADSQIGLTLKFFEYLALGLVPLVHTNYDLAGTIAKIAPDFKQKITFSNREELMQIVKNTSEDEQKLLWSEAKLVQNSIEARYARFMKALQEDCGA